MRSSRGDLQIGETHARALTRTHTVHLILPHHVPQVRPAVGQPGCGNVVEVGGTWKLLKDQGALDLHKNKNHTHKTQRQESKQLDAIRGRHHPRRSGASSFRGNLFHFSSFSGCDYARISVNFLNISSSFVYHNFTGLREKGVIYCPCFLE